MKKTVIVLIALLFSSSTYLFAQSTTNPKIKVEKIAENFHKIYVNDFVYMFIFNGSDGAVLIDTAEEPLDLIDAELKKIGVTKIKYIINTHAHGDHVEGNTFFGQEAIIISSTKCRDLLLEDKDFPKTGLPNLTFSDSLSIHINDEKINLFFLPAHSSSDVVVQFEKANIICIGDIGFFKRYGNWPGLSANTFEMEKSMTFMTKRFSEDALMICGHHSAYSMSQFKVHTTMLSEAIHLVNPLIKKGLTLNQIKEQKPLDNSSFLMVRENADHWIEDIFRSSNDLTKSDL